MHVLTHTPSEMQERIFKMVLNPETLTLWIEAAFEYQESIGENIPVLIALHADTSFLPYFHKEADREVRVWAAKIDPVSFNIPTKHCSCGCVLS